MAISKNPYFIPCLLFSTAVYLFVAFNNQGYIHPDEFFQIVEFASYKLGITPPADLPWEFHEQIRPAFQPALCFGIFSGLDVIGISDHYIHLFVLRLLSAYFTLMAITLFCRANLPYVEERYQKYYILATYLFWVPYFYGSHFSSETWSGNFILMAIALVVMAQQGRVKWKPVLTYGAVGVLCGTAFIFRFQVAFFVVGLALWLLIIRREKITSLLAFTAGGLLMVLIGFVTDHWFYGEWVFTPWKYFESNLIKGVASNFGVLPPETYLLWLLTFPSPVIGAVILLCLGAVFLRLPKSIYTWVLLPFLIGHSVIGHKEERFVFPLFNFVPVVVMLGYQVLASQYKFSFSKLPRVLRLPAVSLLVLSNFVMLLVLVLLATRFSTDPKNFQSQLHQMAKAEKLNIVYVQARAHPFIVPADVIKKDLFPGYLREENIAHTPVSSYCDKVPYNGTPVIATTKYELENDPCLQMLKGEYTIRMHTFPGWMEELPIEKYAGARAKDAFDENVFYILVPK